MSELADLELTLLDLNELLRLSRVFVDSTNEFFPGEPWLLRVAGHVDTGIGNMRSVLDYEGINDLVRLAHEADDARDDGFLDFRLAVEFSQSRRRDPAVKRAGDELMELIRHYGYSLHAETFGDQTLLTDALLDALAEPANATLVADAGLEDDVEVMLETNAAYKQADSNRQQAEKLGQQLPTRREVRSAIRRDLSLLHDSIELVNREDPTAAANAIQTFNERIEPITTPAKARRTRQQSEGEAGEAESS